MNRVYTFHETVRGHLHILNKLPCEDASIDFSSEDGKFQIAIVADGHGSTSCFRSSFGAKAAVNVALECLRQFAEATLSSEETEERFYRDVFFNPHYRQMTVRRLTNTILANWYDCVLDDYKNNPPTAKEVGESLSGHVDEENPEHIYGTTLIAALSMPKCLILLHQGDGRCDVFYSDGSVDQPIPWDPRCHDTTTTSLCDKDAADGFRSHIIDLTQKPVMACYLGCDGVEDAYIDSCEAVGGSHVLMGGVHTFYKDLTCQLAQKGPIEFASYLKEMLPDFSANGRFSRSGSGDDVSVAGIVDLDIINKFIGQYQRDIEVYGLDEQLFWKEDELRSKTRKHGILLKRMTEAKEKLDLLDSSLKDTEAHQISLQQQRDLLAEQVSKAEEELQQIQNEANEETKVENSHPDSISIQKTMKLLGLTFQEICDRITNTLNQYKAKHKKLVEELANVDRDIQENSQKHQQLLDDIHVAESAYQTAKANFEEYDTKYQRLETDRLEILEKIKNLSVEKEANDCGVQT